MGTIKFQFYLSSIKSSSRFPVVSLVPKFQFYLSSIKSKNKPDNIGIPNMFQFYLSSIKSYVFYFCL